MEKKDAGCSPNPVARDAYLLGLVASGASRPYGPHMRRLLPRKCSAQEKRDRRTNNDDTSGAVYGSWFERAFARGNHQIVFEFHQPQEQRNHSRLFDEADRFVGGYPGQLPFALFGPLS
jgi:hypothetical protein